jgi:hypothetical protein
MVRCGVLAVMCNTVYWAVAVGGPSASYIVFPSLCVPSVSTGNLATSPVPGTVSLYTGHRPAVVETS